MMLLDVAEVFCFCFRIFAEILNVLSRRPIASLIDGLMDRRENRRKNRAVGAHNQTSGCGFKESDGIGRTLTCQTRSDGSHSIIHFYHCAKCIMG